MISFQAVVFQNYIEKDIKIKQKSHNPKGFGITVVGGQDKKQPVIVEKVNIGRYTMLVYIIFIVAQS